MKKMIIATISVSILIQRGIRRLAARRTLGHALLVLMALLGASSAMAQDDERDPFERFNRAMYSFNTGVDNAILKPIAHGYVNVIPEPVRNCVGNIFGNVADVSTGVNNVLQGKVGEGIQDMCRIALNTTVGIFGCFDVASKIGLPKHKEDFGQTLAKWGVGSGPYLMLPLFGPSTLRDSTTYIVDSKMDYVATLDHIPTRNELMALRLVDKRAQLLYTTDMIERAALDPYVFVRTAYFQRRNSDIHDGNLPSPSDDEDAPAPKKSEADSLPASSDAGQSVDTATVIAPQSAVTPDDRWFDQPNQRVGLILSASLSADRSRTVVAQAGH